jgi:hypothetical protein
LVCVTGVFGFALSGLVVNDVISRRRNAPIASDRERLFQSQSV